MLVKHIYAHLRFSMIYEHRGICISQMQDQSFGTSLVFSNFFSSSCITFIHERLFLWCFATS